MTPSEAYEVWVGGDGRSPIALTCEHASVRLPPPWTWGDDAWLVGTHWSVDIGGAELTRDLAAALGAPAVLARFSRLLCDANRAEDDPSVFRDVAEGRPVRLNRDLTAEERERRLATWHRPYHAAVTAMLARHPGRVVLSVHTFTPVYEGRRRDVEIGVLYDREDELAEAFARGMTERGLNVRMNEPYSGKEGLIYAATRHALAAGRRALEIEVRNDLASDPAWRAAHVPAIAAALDALVPTTA